MRRASAQAPVTTQSYLFSVWAAVVPSLDADNLPRRVALGTPYGIVFVGNRAAPDGVITAARDYPPACGCRVTITNVIA